MAISLVTIATATLILLLDVFLSSLRKKLVYIFVWFSCPQFLFATSVFQTNYEKALIGNDDVIVLMT